MRITAGPGVPIGGIILWAGTLASVPDGFAVCNGENGTPDLRDRFVKGAAAGVDPGATGGAATHLHAAGTLLPSAHAGTAVADHASHTHDIDSALASPDLFASTGIGTDTSGRTGGPSATLTHAVTQPNAHTMAGETAAVNGEPAFYALAYIQRIS